MRPSGTRKLAIAFIVALALILSWFVLEQTSDANPLRDVFAQILSPPQLAAHRGARPVGQFFQQIASASQLAKDNQDLLEENARLKSEIVRLREAQIENETLRRQLKFKSAVPNYKLLSAEVIGQDPSNLLHYLIIDRGSSDDIERGMPVITAEGLVGRISAVSSGSATVMLLTDPSSSVSGLVQRSRATGIVQGHTAQKLVMRYIPQGDTVTVGDTVISSGLGGNFPKRLVIGHVSEVTNRDVAMFQEATVQPATSLRDVEVVMVVLSFTSETTSQDGP